MEKDPLPAAPPEAESPAGEPATALTQTREELERTRQQWLRALADFDNYRKRSRREHDEQRQQGIQEAVRILLPAWDNLDRALAHPGASAEDLRRGIELTGKQWAEGLRKLGVEPVPAVGETFNPHLHQAVEMVDTTDVPDHTVLEELQRGYQMHGRLLRPAMVRVAHNPQSSPGGGADENADG